MEREHAPACGRRTMTVAMITAQARCPEVWEPAARGRALSALKRAAPALAIPRRVVELVDYLVGRSQAADWAEGGRPMAWPSNATLQDALGLQRSQVHTLIRLGQEWGLFAMEDGPGGRRWGRVEGGRVVEAWGFDLTPLAARRAEFEQVAAAHEERRREGRRLRGRITALSKQVQALAEAGSAQDLPGADWAALATEARVLAARRGEGEDPGQLAPLAERLAALRDAAKGVLLAAARAGVKTGETGPSGPAERTPITPTTYLSIATATTAAHTPSGAAGPDRPRAHGEGSNRGGPGTSGQGPKPAPSESGRGGTVPKPASCLRGFVVTPDWLVQVAPAFQSWVNSARPGWDDMAEAASYVCSELDISRHAWGQACVVLGRMEAVTILAAIAARHARGEVRSPGGLLRKMVELHQAGTLRLDRTLFGIADGMRREGARIAGGREARARESAMVRSGPGRQP